MDKPKLLIIGAGGHGKVVADIANQSGLWREIAFLDDKYPEVTQLCQWPILAKLADAAHFKDEYNYAVIAIGNNSQRMLQMTALKALGYSFPVIRHNSAIVSSGAEIHEGVVISPGAIVNIGACVKAGVIINSAAIIEHDCVLDEGVHISPRVALAGGVQVGKQSWLGIGATVIANKRIGDYVLVGAGAVVIDDLPDHITAVGVPAKKLVQSTISA